MKSTFRIGALLLFTLNTLQCLADSTEARCDVYPAGSDQARNSGPCIFSQRQGFVTISMEDGTRHELSPSAEAPGNYRDGQGGIVYRQSGLGSAGLIFRFPEESIYLYWQTLVSPADPSQPYSTDDFDATAKLACRAAATADRQRCPAGILRMEDGQASIVVLSPEGAEFTMNFMKTYVNATGGREVEAELKGDTWFVTVDGKELYEVPLAAIEGG